MLEPGGQDNLGIARVGSGDGLGGILDQVEHDLDQLVAVAPDRRQRRVVMLGEADMRGKSALREHAHMFKHAMDVHRAARDRLFGEYLHPVDQIPDAVGLVADQHGQFPVRFVHRRFQQLGGAANARERVLHLMREDRRHAGNAARGAAKRELPVQRPCGRRILHHQQHSALFLRQRGTLNGDPLLVQPRTFKCQFMIRDRDAG